MLRHRFLFCSVVGQRAIAPSVLAHALSLLSTDVHPAHVQGSDKVRRIPELDVKCGLVFRGSPMHDRANEGPARARLTIRRRCGVLSLRLPASGVQRGALSWRSHACCTTRGMYAQFGWCMHAGVKEGTPTPSSNNSASKPSRPQELFVPAVDNSNTPFVPQLEHLEGIMDEVVAAGGTSRGHAPLNKQQVANLNANEFASGRKATYGPTHLA
jgi:hypothetical protein